MAAAIFTQKESGQQCCARLDMHLNWLGDLYGQLIIRQGKKKGEENDLKKIKISSSKKQNWEQTGKRWKMDRFEGMQHVIIQINRKISLR